MTARRCPRAQTRIGGCGRVLGGVLARARTRASAAGPQAGMVTAFVAILALALFLLAGIVWDGGTTLAGYVRATDEAQEAARAGAQQINLATYRTTGTIVINQTAARTAAEDYLAATGDTGTVTTTGDTVSVTVTHVQSTQILQLAGVRALTVTGTATAHPDLAAP